MKQATKRYVIEFTLAMIAYAIVLIISISIVNSIPSHIWWRIPIALAPVIPSGFIVFAFARFFRNLDELQQKIHLNALAFAFAGTALLTFSYGFLENVGFPVINWLFVWPLMNLLWGLGAFFASRKFS